MTIWDRKQHKEKRGRMMRLIENLVRRAAVIKTGDFWSAEASEDESSKGLEVFGQVGFRSRPLEGGDAEALILRVGASENHEVIVATRDRGIEVAIDADETAIFNSTGAVVKIDKDGNIAITSKAGGTVSVDDGSGATELALKSELTALEAHVDQHRHDAPQASAGSLPTSIPTTTAAGALVGSADAAPASVGTAVIKGK